MVSATEIPAIISKPFLSKWQQKLCQCLTHASAKKTAFKEVEKRALEKFGKGHCGLIYADEVKDNAGDLGTAVHACIEHWFINGELPVIDNEAAKWALKIVALYQAHNVTPAVIKPEGLLVDDESGLCGSPDTIGEWDGRIEIIDTKIKNQLDELTGMQGMAYRYLLRRLYNVDIRYMRIVWCKKESENKDIETVVIDLDEWADPWKGLVAVWNKTHKKRQIKLFD